MIYHNHDHLLGCYKSTVGMFDRVYGDLGVKAHNIDANYLKSVSERDLAMSRKIQDMCDQGKDKLLLLIGLGHYKVISKLLERQFNVLTIMSFINPPAKEEDLKFFSKDEIEVFYGGGGAESIMRYESTYKGLRDASQTMVVDRGGNKVLPLDFYRFPDIDVSKVIGEACSALEHDEL